MKHNFHLRSAEHLDPGGHGLRFITSISMYYKLCSAFLLEGLLFRSPFASAFIIPIVSSVSLEFAAQIHFLHPFFLVNLHRLYQPLHICWAP